VYNVKLKLSIKQTRFFYQIFTMEDLSFLSLRR
jgi:hypothetical protein